MNYENIIKHDLNNGVGFRVSLFCCGCSFRCLHCHNRDLWNPYSGKQFTEEVKTVLFDEVSKPYYDGLSLLGGEPTHKNNIGTLTALAKEFKEHLPTKTIWMWTGNLFEDIDTLEILNYIDIVVDGLYDHTLRDINLAFRGSSNQRIIDVKETLLQKEIILATQYYEQ